jgi:predicted nicotinamide N-methyase
MTSAVATIIQAVSPVSIFGAGAGAGITAAVAAGAGASSALPATGARTRANIRHNIITTTGFISPTFMVHPPLCVTCIITEHMIISKAYAKKINSPA